MGYAIETTGRLLLPKQLEPQALTVLEVELAGREGPFDVDTHVDSLAELAGFAGAAVRREGDWLLLATDAVGDPRWSDQATGFYTGLARWVHQGEVHVAGQDGGRWSYQFGPDGVIQIGQNGWDGSIVPFGEPVPHSPAPAADHPGHHPALLVAVFLVGLALVIGLAMLVAGI